MGRGTSRFGATFFRLGRPVEDFSDSSGTGSSRFCLGTPESAWLAFAAANNSSAVTASASPTPSKVPGQVPGTITLPGALLGFLGLEGTSKILGTAPGAFPVLAITSFPPGRALGETLVVASEEEVPGI